MNVTLYNLLTVLTLIQCNEFTRGILLMMLLNCQHIDEKKNLSVTFFVKNSIGFLKNAVRANKIYKESRITTIRLLFK